MISVTNFVTFCLFSVVVWNIALSYLKCVFYCSNLKVNILAKHSRSMRKLKFITFSLNLLYHIGERGGLGMFCRNIYREYLLVCNFVSPLWVSVNTHFWIHLWGDSSYSSTPSILVSVSVYPDFFIRISSKDLCTTVGIGAISSPLSVCQGIACLLTYDHYMRSIWYSFPFSLTSVCYTFFSGLAHRLFLIFCMKLGVHRCKKVTKPDFW